MVRHLCCLVALLLAATAPDGAQRLTRPFPRVEPPSTAMPLQGIGAAEPSGPGPVVVLSAMGGVAGLATGYAIGYPLVYQPSRAADLRRGCEDCGLGGAIGTLALMTLGETVGIAVGAHLGNARRGNFAADFWTSAGALLLGSVVAGGVSAAGAPAGVALLVVPITQIAAVVAVERHVARARTP